MDFKPKDLTVQQQECLRRLAHQLVSLLEHRRRMIELDDAMQQLDQAHQELVRQRTRADDLLDKVLPNRIGAELKANGKVEPRFYPAASILFADVAGFTPLTERLEPRLLIGMLDRYFAAFDEVLTRHGVEKLKTVGDAYIAVAGVPELDRLHVMHACLVALEMQQVVLKIRAEREKLRLPFFDLRIGIHTGAVIAGVVGTRRFTFDVWGDAVNLASRMESHGEVGRINVSEQVMHYGDPYFEFTERGLLEVKGKKPMKMFYLNRLKPEFSVDDGGLRGNERLAEIVRSPRVG